MTRAPSSPPSARKTYAHLASARRVPDDYEISTTQLLYYPALGFEVEAPLVQWYAQHQRSSPFTCDDWERFSDPRRTTYARYVEIQRDREVLADGLLEVIEANTHDATTNAPLRDAVRRVAAQLRYTWHALQMTAAYVGQMAPSGRVAIVALFQAADEMRRIQRVAYWMGLLRQTDRDFGVDARRAWERDPSWQPLRELVERMLVAFDWGEALVALNLCVKPVLDEVATVRLASLATQSGDPRLGALLKTFHAETLWHRAWAHALVRDVVDQNASARDAVSKWIDVWSPRALAAAVGLAAATGAPGLADGLDELLRSPVDLVRGGSS